MPLRLTIFFFFFQAEDGIRDYKVTGVQTCALPISTAPALRAPHAARRRPVRGRDLGRRRPLSGARGEPAHRRARRADPRELRAALHAPQAEDDPQYADRGRAGRPADRGRLDRGRRRDRTGGGRAVLEPVPVAGAPFSCAPLDLLWGLPARWPRRAVRPRTRPAVHGRP